MPGVNGINLFSMLFLSQAKRCETLSTCRNVMGRRSAPKKTNGSLLIQKTTFDQAALSKRREIYRRGRVRSGVPPPATGSASGVNLLPGLSEIACARTNLVPFRDLFAFALI